LLIIAILTQKIVLFLCYLSLDGHGGKGAFVVGKKSIPHMHQSIKIIVDVWNGKQGKL